MHANFSNRWYDDECIYVLANRIVDAVGLGLKRAEIARILDNGGYLKKKDPDGRKTFRRVAVGLWPLIPSYMTTRPSPRQNSPCIRVLEAGGDPLVV